MRRYRVRRHLVASGVTRYEDISEIINHSGIGTRGLPLNLLKRVHSAPTAITAEVLADQPWAVRATATRADDKQVPILIGRKAEGRYTVARRSRPVRPRGNDIRDTRTSQVVHRGPARPTIAAF